MSKLDHRWWIVAAVCMGSCQASPTAPAAQTSSAPATGALATGHATPTPADEAEVRSRERAWLDAYEQSDPAVMADVLADGFLITSPNGRRLTKANVLAGLRRPRAATENTRFVTRGTVALARDGVIVLIGEVVAQTVTEPPGEHRETVSSYTDTWVREGTVWRVLASHLSSAQTPKP
jgi:ketosteroid isomerase-like protein